MSQQLNVKVYFKPGSQVRRVKIDSTTTLEEATDQFIEFFESSPSFKLGEHSYYLMYKDEEGDWVSIDREEEWREAVANFLRKGEEPLLRIQFLAVNKSLEKINEVRKECQESIVNRYNDNVRPLLQQLKEYLKDPQKQQEAKDWLVQVGVQAQEGFEDIQTWINREVPPKVDEVVKELEKMAEKVADKVEQMGVFPRTPDQEPQHAEEIVLEVNTDPEDFILIDNEIQLEDEEERAELYPETEFNFEPDFFPVMEHIPQPQEEVPEVVVPVVEVPVVEVKEPEVVVPVVEVKEPEIAIPQQFENAMRNLEEMGFTDRAKNLHFLKDTKGDMVKTVSALLSLPF
jgi:hypothetical protein